MVDADDITGGLLLVGYIAASSALGLAFQGLFEDPAGAIAFIGQVWSASVMADLAFVAGMVAAGLVGARLAKNPRHTFLAMGASLVLALATYWMAFLLLPDAFMGGTVGQETAQGPLDALPFVASWGAPGLVFSALAPALWVRFEDELLTPGNAGEAKGA